eukprot:4716078-Amphidinium_carterae.1
MRMMTGVVTLLHRESERCARVVQNRSLGADPCLCITRASDVPQEKSEKPTVTVRLTRRGSAAVSSKNAGVRKHSDIEHRL